MKYNVKMSLQSFALIVSFFIAGCSGNGGVIRSEVNGQVFESRIQQVNCFIGVGADVLLVSPLSCNITFNTRNLYSDIIRLQVSDVRPIYDSGIDTWLPVNSGAIEVMLTLQGQPQSVVGGAVRFSRISNVRGDEVCADIEVLTQFGQVDGNFCGVLQSGF